MTRFNLLKNLFAILMTLSLVNFAFAEEAQPARAADDASDDDAAPAAAAAVLAAPGGVPAGLAVPLVSTSTTTVEEQATTTTVTQTGPLPDCDTPECTARRACEVDPYAKCWDADNNKCVCIDGYKWSKSLDRCMTLEEWNERAAMQTAVRVGRENKAAIGALDTRTTVLETDMTSVKTTLTEHAEAINDFGNAVAAEAARNDVQDKKITANRGLALEGIRVGNENSGRLDDHDDRLKNVEERAQVYIDANLGGMIHFRTPLGDDDDGDIRPLREPVAGYVVMDGRLTPYDPRTGFGGVIILGGGFGPGLAADPDTSVAPSAIVYALGGGSIPLPFGHLNLAGGFSWEATDIEGGKVLSDSRNVVFAPELVVRNANAPVHWFLRGLFGGGTASSSYEDGGETFDMNQPTWFIAFQTGVSFGTPRAKLVEPKITEDEYEDIESIVMR